MSMKEASAKPRSLGCAIAGVVAISGVVNLLSLAGVVYMLQVFDRVLTSHSIATLVALSTALGIAYLAFGALDTIRAQIMLRIAAHYEECHCIEAVGALTRAGSTAEAGSRSLEPVRDVETVRAFLSGPVPLALMDLPWVPLFLLFVLALSPVLAAASLLAIAAILATAWLAQVVAARHEKAASESQQRRLLIAENGATGIDTVRAMGLGEALAREFRQASADYLKRTVSSGDMLAGLSSLSKVLRLALQSGILGIGAWLAIRGDVTGGAIVAASIAAQRALAPLEQAVLASRSLAAVRAAARRVADRKVRPTPAVSLALRDDISAHLSLEGVALLRPSARRPILKGVSFELIAGDAVAIVGATASGKTALAHVLAGIASPSLGAAHLNGLPISQLSPAERARMIGYLGDTVALFPGSVGRNIARLDEDPDMAGIVAAASSVGVHRAISELPDSYSTCAARAEHILSSGQRRQLALARAFYGRPGLIVLDEPAVDLDAEGEAALYRAVAEARARGAIVAITGKRRATLGSVNKVLVIAGGTVERFGPAAEFTRSSGSSQRAEGMGGSVGGVVSLAGRKP
jgi:ATP-binding cassette subfamily C protein